MLRIEELGNDPGTEQISDKNVFVSNLDLDIDFIYPRTWQPPLKTVLAIEPIKPELPPPYIKSIFLLTCT